MAHSLRAEAIRLYRDIFRVTRVFRGLKGGDGADTCVAPCRASERALAMLRCLIVLGLV